LDDAIAEALAVADAVAASAEEAAAGPSAVKEA
jgi:hypothetical protein